MAQATILAAAQTAATSSDVTVAAGSVLTVGIFATGDIPTGVEIGVYIDTPGSDLIADVLNFVRPAKVISGPGTFRVVRPNITNYGKDVGVFTE